MTAKNQIPLTILLHSLLSIFILAKPTVAEETQFDPNIGLDRDIKILSAMTQTDLSPYPIPSVVFVEKDEFNRKMSALENNGKIADYRFIENKGRFFVSNQDCDKETKHLEISTDYAEVAKIEEMEPADYFQKIRFHTLYHWSQCMISGPKRQTFGLASWKHEEAYAYAMETLFWKTQHGQFKAEPEDFKLPPPPQSVDKNLFPEPTLQYMKWKVVEAPVRWETVEGADIFVYVAWALAIKGDGDRTKTLYYTCVMHRGNYVGFEVFEVTGGAFTFAGKKGYKLLNSWWDEGYVSPNGRNAPNRPEFKNRWEKVK